MIGHYAMDINNSFGLETLNAVKAFQQDRGLASDGGKEFAP